MERIEKIKEFLKSTPEDNFLRHALALEYIKIGKETEARQLFESILTQDPQYIGSYYHLAKLLERIGDTEGAIRWYEKGMDIAKNAGEQHALGELKSAYEELVY